MGVEIEKKYRLPEEERERLPERLRAAGAEFEGDEFETNTLYSGNNLDTRGCVLRLRRTEKRAVLTYKERGTITTGVKRHREEETEVTDADALDAILRALGYAPSLVYEKRRATWHVGGTEVVVDELPFGAFMEIEGEENLILDLERTLELSSAEGVNETYPDLVERYGERKEGIVEARFK